MVDMVKKKLKLFIVFIDFSKAYDRVNRDKLFRILIRLGCGLTMITAIMGMYRVTNSVIGTALITAGGCAPGIPNLMSTTTTPGLCGKVGSALALQADTPLSRVRPCCPAHSLGVPPETCGREKSYSPSV